MNTQMNFALQSLRKTEYGSNTMIAAFEAALIFGFRFRAPNLKGGGVSCPPAAPLTHLQLVFICVNVSSG